MKIFNSSFRQIVDISIICVSLFSVIAVVLAFTEIDQFKKIEKNGMWVKWKIEDQYLQVEMFAPTDGWVAIGFNEKTGLAGTNLIMGCIEDKQPKVIDYYTVKPGNYRPIVELGGDSAIEDFDGTEIDHKTTIRFKVKTMMNDNFHQHLKQGKEFHLLMAYSQEDDFNHHSIMRTTTIINL